MQSAASDVRPDVERFRALLREHLPDLRQRYAVETLSLFGSYVRGEQQLQSDLDVLVEFSEAPSLFTFLHLEREIASLLGIPVDLVMKDALKPTIGRRILQEAVPV